MLRNGKENGFSEKGSLSVNQLRKVEEHFKVEERDMLNKKKVKSVDVRRINDEKRCLKM